MYFLKIEINIDNVYNTFIDIFRQKFREEDITHKYKLTTINTKIPYLIIDENNISNIFNEKIENDEILKILITKEEDEEIKGDNKDEKFFRGFIKNNVNDDEDDFNDDDFVFVDKNTKTGDIKIIENDVDKNEGKDQENELNKLLDNSINNAQNEIKINENNRNEISNKIEDDNDDIDNNLILSNIDNSKKELNKEDNNEEEKNEVPLLPVIPLNIPNDIFNSDNDEQ